MTSCEAVKDTIDPHAEEMEKLIGSWSIESGGQIQFGVNGIAYTNVTQTFNPSSTCYVSSSGVEAISYLLEDPVSNDDVVRIKYWSDQCNSDEFFEFSLLDDDTIIFEPDSAETIWTRIE